MGRSYDLLNAPLPQGGHVVCAVETTSLLAARDEAETTLARVTSALATLRTGLATFTSDRALLFSNPRFAELLGLPAERLQPGMDFGDLLKLILTMRAERSVAVLWATHLCDEVADADRVIVLHRGKVLADTTPTQFIKNAGAGTIDLGTQMMGFRVEPKLVMTTQGQSRTSDPVGFGIPVMIEGPWSSPRIYPEMQGMLDNPDGAYAKLREMGKGLFGPNGGGLGSMLGALTGKPPAGNDSSSG